MIVIAFSFRANIRALTFRDKEEQTWKTVVLVIVHQSYFDLHGEKIDAT
jgi:hypothetical protein